MFEAEVQLADGPGRAYKVHLLNQAISQAVKDTHGG
jgi:hypothetical protein